MTTDADAFDFYPCLVDDALASIYVNMRYELVKPPGADTRYCVATWMRDIGEEGIGTAPEGETLSALEVILIDRLAEHGLVYAGRIRGGGIWESVFYGPAGRDAIVRTHEADGRRVEVMVEPDAGWRYYAELLLPDDERRQWMDDRRLVQILREQGDSLVTPRPVDHRAYFPSAEARERFIAAVADKGFTLVSSAEEDESDRRFGATVAREDSIELDHVHEVVMTIVDAATAVGGAYGGWTAAILR